MGRKIDYVVGPESDGTKVYDFLRRKQGLSYRLITSLKHNPSGIVCNGRHIRTIDTVYAGDVVSITMEEHRQAVVESDLTVEVLYDDADVLVYNKPAGMNCHQSRREQNNTLANVFARYCREHGLPPLTFRCVNRLDKDTTGLVLLAKNQHAAALLKSAVKKEYMALVHGTPALLAGTVSVPIGRINDVSTKRQIDPCGQPATTHYLVEARGEGYSLLRVWLATGRTHQIRVHMAYLGHPLAGDDLYGGSTELLQRQALHCCYMRFCSPISKKLVSVRAPLPEDIQKALVNAKIYI